MVFKNKKLVAIATAALSIFLTVTYFSCSKPGTIVSCTGTTCQNGGACYMDTLTKKPTCQCPTGYEGSACQTASVNKFFGTWELRQVVQWSDSAAYIGDTSFYQIQLAASATPTTFFINNFFNNTYYNDIICTLDSTNSSNFYIDTTSAYHMILSHFFVLGGYGSINGDTINAIMCIYFKNQSTNWQIDTVAMTMYNKS